MHAARRSERAFLFVTAVLFGISAAVTVVWCGSMSTMHRLPMPGGWTMTMAWMRMPGQSAAGAAAAFLAMWCVMMVAMMLPVLAPTLLRHRRSFAPGDARRDRSTLAVALAYFGVWVLVGAITYPIGVALNAAAMQWAALSRAMPALMACTLVFAGALQFTGWKRRVLACCRDSRAHCREGEATARRAWRHGLHLGWQCVQCCTGLTALLFVLGVMDLRAMAMVAGLIAIERLAPGGRRVAQLIGVLLVVAGLCVLRP